MGTVGGYGTTGGGGGGGGTVTSVVGGANVKVDSTTPAAPVVSTGAKRGSNLTNTDQTIQPGTDGASEYVLLVNLTANHTVTLGVTSVVTNQLVRIERNEGTPSANTLGIVNGGTSGGTILTFAANPTGPQAAIFMFNGADWVAVGFEFPLI